MPHHGCDDLFFSQHALHDVVGTKSPYVPSIATAATGSVITREEAKAQARIKRTDENDLIDAMIDAAVKRIEVLAHHTLSNPEFDSWWDFFPSVFYLPKTPLVSVTSVKYTNDSGVETTVDSSVYTVDVDHLPPQIYQAFEQTWPTDLRAIRKAVVVRFKPGYAVSGSLPNIIAATPEALKAAVKLLFAHYYEQREAFVDGRPMFEVPEGVKALVSTFRHIEAH